IEGRVVLSDVFQLFCCATCDLNRPFGVRSGAFRLQQSFRLHPRFLSSSKNVKTSRGRAWRGQSPSKQYSTNEGGKTYIQLLLSVRAVGPSISETMYAVSV